MIRELDNKVATITNKFRFCVHHIDWEDRAGCFALFVFLVSRDFRVALPRGAMGLSAVCDCSIPDHTHLLFSNH